MGLFLRLNQGSHQANVVPCSISIQVTLMLFEGSMFVGVKSKNHFPDHESAARGHLGPVQLTAGNNQSEENKVHSSS